MPITDYIHSILAASPDGATSDSVAEVMTKSGGWLVHAETNAPMACFERAAALALKQLWDEGRATKDKANRYYATGAAVTA